ncbi:MAG: hypothetical protein IJF49_04380 [Clostridia bacterium]|nr:hypothetical protein [Clostridia bacterium]
MMPLRSFSMPADVRCTLRCFCASTLILCVTLSGLRTQAPRDDREKTPVIPTALTMQFCGVADDMQLDLLARVLAAEVGDLAYGTQAAYAAMLLNRVSDPRFPRELGAVIAEAGLKTQVGELSSRSIRAARTALLGVDQTSGALYCFPAGDHAAAALFADRITLRLDDMIFAK